MDLRRSLAGTVAGAVVLIVTGYLIFNIAFAAFYAANAGSATGVDRTPQLLWPMVVSALAYAALIAYAMNNRAVMSLGGGAAVGAIVGFLMWWPVHGATGGVAVAAVVKSMSPSVQPRAGGVARV